MRINRRVLMTGGALLLAGCATPAVEGVFPGFVSQGVPVDPDVTVTNVDLWPGGAPGGAGVTISETIVERSKDPSVHDRAAFGVRRPRVKVFRPKRPDGSAVLVIPGGGYQRVVLDKEGDETAMKLAKSGVTCAVLVYRLPGDGWAAGVDASLQDAERAFRLLSAGKLAPGVDARRVGVLGFSAGGNVAASLAFRGGAAAYPAIDATDSLAARPAFAALIYAAYLDGKGLPQGLNAPDYTALVAKGAQPVFLAHAKDDDTVPIAGTQRMAAALQAAGSPVEVHVFDSGGHGFGIAKARGTPAEPWADMFQAWGRAQGFFKR
jgi:acetyl esterase/lipase